MYQRPHLHLKRKPQRTLATFANEILVVLYQICQKYNYISRDVISIKIETEYDFHLFDKCVLIFDFNLV